MAEEEKEGALPDVPSRLLGESHCAGLGVRKTGMSSAKGREGRGRRGG
jgi:hypothetical protein